MTANQAIPNFPLTADNRVEQLGGNGLPVAQVEPKTYMTTVEAAKYLRKSTSWLLRQGDIPYLPGKPNIYAKRHLDEWFDDAMHSPLSR